MDRVLKSNSTLKANRRVPVIYFSILSFFKLLATYAYVKLLDLFQIYPLIVVVFIPTHFKFQNLDCRVMEEFQMEYIQVGAPLQEYAVPYVGCRYVLVTWKLIIPKS